MSSRVIVITAYGAGTTLSSRSCRSASLGPITFRPVSTTGVTVAVTAANVNAYTMTGRHANLTAATEIWTYDSATGEIAGP